MEHNWYSELVLDGYDKLMKGVCECCSDGHGINGT